MTNRLLKQVRSGLVGQTRLHLVALALALAWPSAAPAEVELSFHSRALGTSFPHAFIVMRGTVDATGEPVDANYGFTVRHLIGPSVLLGSVRGQVISEPAHQAARGRRHFSVALSDAEYRRVIGVVEQWRALPQPSYHLDRRNCVSFVAAIASAIGLQAVPDGATRRRPQAFLDAVLQLNRALILRRVPGQRAPRVAGFARQTRD